MEEKERIYELKEEVEFKYYGMYSYKIQIRNIEDRWYHRYIWKDIHGNIEFDKWITSTRFTEKELQQYKEINTVV